MFVIISNLPQLAEPSLVEALRGELSDARGEAEQLRSQLLSVKEELQSERDRLCSLQTKTNSLMHESGELEEANIRMKEKIARLEVRTHPSYTLSYNFCSFRLLFLPDTFICLSL